MFRQPGNNRIFSSAAITPDLDGCGIWQQRRAYRRCGIYRVFRSPEMRGYEERAGFMTLTAYFMGDKPTLMSATTDAVTDPHVYDNMPSRTLASTTGSTLLPNNGDILWPNNQFNSAAMAQNSVITRSGYVLSICLSALPKRFRLPLLKPDADAR